LSLLSSLKLFHLLHFSKPHADRALYRAIHVQKFRKMLLLGIGTGDRAMRMIEVASDNYPSKEVHLIGIDPFEDRTPAEGPGLPLREAYRMLHTSGTRVQLVPGDVPEGLMRTANSLGQVDLLVLSAAVSAEQLGRAWFFVPRLLHERSEVYVEQVPADGKPLLQRMERSQIGALSNAAARRRAA
jgi:hypothetical protein